MNAKVLAAAAICVGASIAPLSGAPAVTIGFEAASPLGSSYAGPTTESGYTYFKQAGSLYLNVHGNPGQDVEATGGGGGGVLEVASATPGAQFLYSGLDFAAESSDSVSQTVTVTGLLGGSVVGADTYSQNGIPFSVTLTNWIAESASNLAGMAVDELLISLSTSDGYAAIDNLRLDTAAPVTTPEPASLALLGAGLAGIGAIRRRKR